MLAPGWLAVLPSSALTTKLGLGRRDDGRRAYHWPPRFTRPGGEDGDNDWHENDGTGQTSERVARWQARGRNRLGSIWWSFFLFLFSLAGVARWGLSNRLVGSNAVNQAFALLHLCWNEGPLAGWIQAGPKQAWVGGRLRNDGKDGMSAAMCTVVTQCVCGSSHPHVCNQLLHDNIAFHVLLT